MDTEVFDINFEVAHKPYKGWVTPSDRINSEGQPASFSVVLNQVFFGHISLNDCKWDNSEQRPQELVEAAGKEIEKHFKL